MGVTRCGVGTANILPKGEMKKLVEWTASSAINTGSNQTNRLGIFAVGKRLILYVNRQAAH